MYCFENMDQFEHSICGEIGQVEHLHMWHIFDQHSAGEQLVTKELVQMRFPVFWIKLIDSSVEPRK